MKKLFFIFFISSLSIFTYNCASVNEADEVAEQFHQFLQNRDFEGITTLLHSKALEATPKNDWIRLFTENAQRNGDLTSFKKTGFNSSINNGIKTVVLDFNIEFGEQQYFERINFQEENGTLKIIYYQFDKNKSKLD